MKRYLLDSIANWIARIDFKKILAHWHRTVIQLFLFGVWCCVVGGKAFTFANLPAWTVFCLSVALFVGSYREVVISVFYHFSLLLLIWLLYWGGDLGGAWSGWFASLDNAFRVNIELLSQLVFGSTPKTYRKCSPLLSNRNPYKL